MDSSLEGLGPDAVIEFLTKLSKDEPDPSSGMMFTHAYESGDRMLRDLARRAFEMYMDKTMLDFTVYPSIVKLERDVVSFVARLMGGGDSVAGSFTFGGTESIMLAVKAARDFFKSRRPEAVPEMILPYTAHPAFFKAASYLGLKPILIPVNPDTFKVDLDLVQERVGKNTAIIVGSAPNYPFGVVDDIRGLSEIALDNNTWLHVDACIGGFILPFFRELGEPIPDFDFKLEGVYSISVDLHKYGYTPKGASVILYRDRGLRKYQYFVYSRWPGYPLVNTAILSTRSAGPLAASWAVIKYLGYKGYLSLASRTLNAKKKLVKGIKEIGLKILGAPESSIIAFTDEEVNIVQLSIAMKRRGWILQVQPGSIHLGFPQSIHLTISPIHEMLVEVFLKDLKESLEDIRQRPFKVSPQELMELLGAPISVGKLVEKLGLSRENVLSDDVLLLVNEAIRVLPPDVTENIILEAVNDLVF